MNRIEIVGLFVAMEELMEAKQYESVKRMIKAVLNEAQTKQNNKKQNKETNDA